MCRIPKFVKFAKFGSCQTATGAMSGYCTEQFLLELLRYASGIQGFPHSSVSKASACSAGDPGSIPGSGRSSGEGNSNPVQYSCLENPMDRRVWQATVHGGTRVGHSLATESQAVQHTLSNFLSFYFEMIFTVRVWNENYC